MASSESEPRLTLHLLGFDQDVPVEELVPEPSPHTGRPLRRARISFRVSAEESDAVTAELNNARSREHALVSPDGSCWIVRTSQHSYTEGDRVHRHEAELGEVEELQAERLEMLGLRLVPTRYEERAEDGGIVITARVLTDADTDAALEQEIVRDRDDDPYFEVIRVGVSDTPIRMRFGRCLWEQTEQGRLHLLRLVTEAGDSEETQRGLLLNQPELGNVARTAIAMEEAIEALLEELQAADVLPENTIAAIRSRVDAAWETRGRAFDEARDIDDYF